MMILQAAFTMQGSEIQIEGVFLARTTGAKHESVSALRTPVRAEAQEYASLLP